MREKQSGIYTITNIENGKYYLGRAVDFEERKQRHLRDLRRNKHYNSYLQRAFNLYGESSFVFKIIENVEPNSLKEAEQRYLNEIEENSCYNMSKFSCGGGLPGEGNPMFGLFGENNPNFGSHRSEETKKKISDIRKINGHPNNGKPMSEEQKKKISIANKGKIVSEESVRNMAQKHEKEYDMISPSGEFIHIRNMAKFCRENNLSAGNMNAVALGKYKQYKGWRKAA